MHPAFHRAPTLGPLPLNLECEIYLPNALLSVPSTNNAVSPSPRRDFEVRNTNNNFMMNYDGIDSPHPQYPKYPPYVNPNTHEGTEVAVERSKSNQRTLSVIDEEKLYEPTTAVATNNTTTNNLNNSVMLSYTPFQRPSGIETSSAAHQSFLLATPTKSECVTQPSPHSKRGHRSTLRKHMNEARCRSPRSSFSPLYHHEGGGGVPSPSFLNTPSSRQSVNESSYTDESVLYCPVDMAPPPHHHHQGKRNEHISKSHNNAAHEFVHVTTPSGGWTMQLAFGTPAEYDDDFNCAIIGDEGVKKGLSSSVTYLAGLGRNNKDKRQSGAGIGESCATSGAATTKHIEHNDDVVRRYQQVTINNLYC
eukprot:PhF_6_TR20457/c0_g1_i1/m.29401